MVALSVFLRLRLPVLLCKTARILPCYHDSDLRSSFPYCMPAHYRLWARALPNTRHAACACAACWLYYAAWPLYLRIKLLAAKTRIARMRRLRGENFYCLHFRRYREEQHAAALSKLRAPPDRGPMVYIYWNLIHPGCCGNLQLERTACFPAALPLPPIPPRTFEMRFLPLRREFLKFRVRIILVGLLMCEYSILLPTLRLLTCIDSKLWGSISLPGLASAPNFAYFINIHIYYTFPFSTIQMEPYCFARSIFTTI